MSLQVWLPLIRDLRQQGLSDVTVTNNGATYNSTGGKLGGCYSFDGTDDRIKISNLPNPQNITITFWMKRNATTNSRQFMFTAWNGITCELNTNNTIHCYVQGSSGGHGICDSTDAITVDTGWIHVAYVFENGVGAKLYINGELKKTTSSTASILWGTTTGNIGNYGNMYFNGKINDFRLYDHALSQMEVKELAKGLILHYTLGDKAIESTTNLFYPLVETSRNTNPAWDKTLNGNYMIHCDGFGDGYNGGVSNPTTGYHGHWIYDENNNLMGILPNLNSVIGQANRWLGLTASVSSTSIGAGNDYTISWEQKTDNLNCYINAGYYYKKNSSESGYGSFHDGTKNCKNTIVNTWQSIEISFTLSQDWDGTYTGGTVYFYGHYGSEGTTYIRNLQFETKNHATAFVNGLTTRTSNTIYDCSGFCNNGEIINSLSISSDTPKYNASIHIGATNQKIHISNFPTSGFGNSYSFAWWGKRNSNSPMFWGFSDGIRLNGMYTGTLWNTGDSGNNPIYKPNTTTTITAPSLNVWHHYVMTGDGITCKLYLDGELYGQAKTYKAISGTSIYINGWDSNTSYCSDNTDMSDFRIYATALSADDVKSLYNNSAYIDSSGNIYGAIARET